jgi:two-component system chemotaxis response regulator CheY
MGGIRILVVDDEPMLRELVCGLLSIAGFEVLEAENGLDAIKKMKEFRPSIIFSDIRMPKFDGFYLIEKVSQMDPPLIPILFMSGYAGGDLEQLKNYANYDGFFQKPLNFDKVLEHFNKLKTLETY